MVSRQKPESGDDRRGAILAAALACFNEHGVEATAVGEICARAGASVGSVYHHFGNKEGIAVALLVEGLASNARQLAVALGEARSARQGVYAVVESLIRWIAANPAWARFIYTASHGGVSRAAADGLRAVNDDYAKVIDGFFGPHVKAGAFRRLPRQCFASLVLGPVHDYARRWLDGQMPGAITDHVELFASAAWNSVRNPVKA